MPGEYAGLDQNANTGNQELSSTFLIALPIEQAFSLLFSQQDLCGINPGDMAFKAIPTLGMISHVCSPGKHNL